MTGIALALLAGIRYNVLLDSMLRITMTKNKIPFPVLKGKTTDYPDKALCPVCGKKKVLEPHSMAILSISTLLMDREKNCSIYDSRADALKLSFDLTWHGAHPYLLGEDCDLGPQGEGDDRNMYETVYIFEDVQRGQGSIYFCSTQCLRTFLNTCVDKLEDKIKWARKKQQPE